MKKQNNKVLELVNADGSVLDKGTEDSDREIATDRINDIKDDDENFIPQTTDHFSRETGQGGKRFFNYGLAMRESDNRKKVIGNLIEDFFANKQERELSQKPDSSTIPKASELSNSYKSENINAELVKLINMILGSEDAMKSDIFAIVLKAIIGNTPSIADNHKNELIKIIKNRPSK